ncbi:DUF6344 domain-containing protein [Streptomyces sp. NPDC088762]|uniref:DUF6344 domain-containing protein n=1 Tax=Streptomyces sp. NPDC088762 TaxID=3365891 RepID=UPI00381EE5BB
MAQRSTLTSIWTSVLTALVALLAALGLGRKAAPAATSPAASGVPASPSAAVCRPAFAARRTWRAMMRGGSLPPTIKQRIRAEAHGKSPSVRRSTTAASMGAGPDAAVRALAPVGAPGGAAEAVVGPAGAVAGAGRDALALAA